MAVHRVPLEIIGSRDDRIMGFWQWSIKARAVTRVGKLLPITHDHFFGVGVEYMVALCRLRGHKLRICIANVLVLCLLGGGRMDTRSRTPRSRTVTTLRGCGVGA